jgi:flagellar basal-body rod protein FlgC
MDYFQAFAISAAGMTLERTRVDVAALNLANANTVQTADGVGYQPMRVVARVGGETTLGATPLFAQQVERGLAGDLAGLTLPQASIEPALVGPRQVYEPSNPFADGKGFVRYPGVDTAAEMVTMMGALRAYEANVAAMNTSRTMLLKALDIGGGA